MIALVLLSVLIDLFWALIDIDCVEINSMLIVQNTCFYALCEPVPNDLSI